MYLWIVEMYEDLEMNEDSQTSIEQFNGLRRDVINTNVYEKYKANECTIVRQDCNVQSSGWPNDYTMQVGLPITHFA